MPRYDYRCELNGQTIEVSHAMNDVINTWDEPCTLAGIEAVDTATRVPVKKLISCGFIATGAGPQVSSLTCAVPSCCRAGACGLDI